MKTRIVFAVILFCLVIQCAFAEDWRPVEPELLAEKTPVVDKNADAEVIFWEVRVEEIYAGGDFQTVLKHYMRIKIFTERGKEKFSQKDIVYPPKTDITDIQARTIKADGTVLELKKEAIFDRVLAGIKRVKIKAKSFALQGIEPGVIIEYRWREARNDDDSTNFRYELQQEIPVRIVKYYIKPLSGEYTRSGMKAIVFNGPQTPFVKEKEGYTSATFTNVPAFREEPRMPPEDNVKIWMFAFYSSFNKPDPQQYWKDYGKRVFEAFKPLIKPNDDIKRAAAEAIADATTPDQKVEKIFEYVRAKVKNINSQGAGFTAEEREKFKGNKNPEDTLKKGVGTGLDILLLFASMVQAAGMEARIARTGDRDAFFFDVTLPTGYFLKTLDIAVKVGNEWRVYDPAATYLPFGMLSWWEEWNHALICDPEEAQFIRLPLSSPEKSIEKRTAKLSLSEDGTIEGDVVIEYTGHKGAQKKSSNDEDSTSEREDTLKEMVKAQMSTSELANIEILNVTDRAKPFTYKYHIRVPGYAQRTGRRLFLQPAFFQKGINPLFPTSSRKYDIYFSYPWSEEDNIQIMLPKGFVPDSPDAPVPISIGKIGSYEAGVSIAEDKSFIIFKRKFVFGGESNIYFKVNNYDVIKQIFDSLHQRDNHTLTLRQAAGSTQ